jgi:hypothetical protein
MSPSFTTPFPMPTPPMPGRVGPGRCRGPGAWIPGPHILPDGLHPEPAAVQAELRRRQVDWCSTWWNPSAARVGSSIFPFCLDAMALPYTGARAETMVLTSGKTLAKGWMAAAGIPTRPGSAPGRGPKSPPRQRSGRGHLDHQIGLGTRLHRPGTPQRDQRTPTTPRCFPLLQSRAPQLGGACFAERFIAGREFNLSLLAGPQGPDVLPPAEIVFEGYTADMPRIVDYRAKWDRRPSNTTIPPGGSISRPPMPIF